MSAPIDCGPVAKDLLTRLTAPTRNRYYYGKLLDAFHLELEQDYANRKRWLLNRLSLGAGVLCGLKVSVSVDRKLVRVGPGVAIDGWGREIVVDTDSPGVDPRQPTDECGRTIGGLVRGAGRVTLWICYHECEAEAADVYVAECDRNCEYGLVRERYRLRISPGPAPKPGLVTPEQCRMIFSAVDRDGRRAKAVEALAGLCTEPAESCVPLATIELDANGLVEGVDPVLFRPMLYSNAVLLDLILCLASRVDECCPPKTINSLSIVSGNNQVDLVNQVLPAPLVVRVKQGAAMVPGEVVTFRVATGGGAIGDVAGPFDQLIQVPTIADGTASLARWRLGPILGSQTVIAEIADPAAPKQVTFQAIGRRIEVHLPIVNTVWPPPRISLSSADSNTREAHDLFLKLRSIELNFNRPMNPGQLDKPAAWLALYIVSGVPNERLVNRIGLRHATPQETLDRTNALISLVPGTREFFIIEDDRINSIDASHRSISPVGRTLRRGAPLVLDPAASIGAAGIGAAALAMGIVPGNAVSVNPTARAVRFVILVNAATPPPTIVDQSAPPLLLDAEYSSSTLQTTAGSAPATSLWDDLWQMGPPGASRTFGESLWTALTNATADVLPSGEGNEGGRLDSWFEITF